MPIPRPHTIIRLAREPLLQFLALGALIFCLHAYFASDTPATGPDTVVVSQQHLAALRSDFVAREARQPTPAELQALTDSWVEEEILYRQAVALGLDQGDRLIRRQMVRKMRYLLEDATPLAGPQPGALQHWLDAHPQRYGSPATTSFQHVFIDRAHADGLARANTLLEHLRSGELQANDAGDPFPIDTPIQRANSVYLQKQFGEDFSAALENQPLHTWLGPLLTRLGWHLVRITERTPFEPSTVESAGERLRVDYRNHQREQANRAALQQLRRRYHLRFEAAPE